MALPKPKESVTRKSSGTSKRTRSSASSPKVSDLEQTILGLREELNVLKNSGTAAELTQAKKELEQAKADLAKLKPSPPQEPDGTERHPFFG